jgi:F-type H+-transporting ATPase subunit delta
VSQRPRILARRYARALVEVAAKGGRDGLIALRDELRAFVPRLMAHDELKAALAHPRLGAEAKQRAVLALAERAQASPLARRLMELLGSRDRLALLGDVAEAYAELANAATGVLSAEAVSAIPLDAAQKRSLETALRGVAESVELTTRVDPALVGGLVVRAHGRTYDGSVRTRLAELGRRLAAG